MGHLVYVNVLSPSCHRHVKIWCPCFRFFFFLLDIKSRTFSCQVESCETRLSVEWSTPPTPPGSDPGLATWLCFVVSTNLMAARVRWRTQLGSHASWGVGTDGRCVASGNPPHITGLLSHSLSHLDACPGLFLFVRLWLQWAALGRLLLTKKRKEKKKKKTQLRVMSKRHIFPVEALSAGFGKTPRKETVMF